MRMSENVISGLDRVVRFFPYVALSAYKDDDSGDRDDDKCDMIEDTIHRWHPGGSVTRINTGSDFSYMLELEDEVLVVNLGTTGGWNGRGWRGNRDAFPLRKTGIHHNFDRAGWELYGKIHDPLRRIGKQTAMIGHSRGCPRGIRASELIYNRCGMMIENFPYNGPPLYTRKGRKRFNKTGIPVHRVDTRRDIVDNAGFFILVHVGERTLLPFKRTWLNSIPILGWLVGGHAYSSVYESLMMRCIERKDNTGLHYLKERMTDCCKI